MRKLILGALVLMALASGCAVTDYPVVTDSRGSFSGVVATGHKAYIQVTSTVATIWTDGSDELFSMLTQNAFGDQHIFTFNNFDPTASVLFLDQTYCDWRYTGCPIVTADNPANSVVDNPFDYTLDTSCSGARSLSLLIQDTARLGECGDAGLMGNRQNFYGEFANLSTTMWRNSTAYLLPVNSSNTQITLNGLSVPIYGQLSGFVTSKMQLVLPMSPNMRHDLSFLRDWIGNNGNAASVGITYGSLDANFQMQFLPSAVNYNLTRF